MSTTPASTAIPGYVAGTWKAERAEIAFSVRQLVVSKARGRFTGHDVTIVTAEDPLESSVEATVDLASVDTGNDKRDAHLRSDDYFDVERYPEMAFRSTGIRDVGDGWIVDGDLTLHGVTAHVPLAMTVAGFDGRRARFTATASVSRRAFGVGSGVASTVIDDAVTVSLHVDAIRSN